MRVGVEYNGRASERVWGPGERDAAHPTTFAALL
jgi:hypothetical protein